MEISRRTGILALLGGMIGLGRTANAKVAFHYQAVFPPEQARWYKRFSLLVTGGILDGVQTRQVRDRNRLVAYEWISGFYQNDPASATRDWQSSLIAKKSRLLLNLSPLGGGAAMQGKEAFWYDFGNPELLVARAERLSHVLAKQQYDGYFFDTLGWGHLPAEIQQRFRKAHPKLDYEQQQGLFLKHLRQRLPSHAVIFLNQGYRNPKVYLPYANLDLSESSFTFLRNGGTGVRMWSDRSTPSNSVRNIMSELILPAARLYPRVTPIHLNYAAGDSATVKRAIQYSFACAKLFDHQSYLVCPTSASLEEDEIYFEEIGRPVASEWSEDESGTVAWREFKGGVVALNCGTGTARVPGLNLVLQDPPRGYVFR